MQTQLKTPINIKPNQNKTFPIGTIQTVKHIFKELNLTPVLDDLKHCGHSLNGLISGLVSYKLTEDLSVRHCHEWMNHNPLLLKELCLDPFGKDALYRGLEKIGKNRHHILHHLVFTLKNQFDVGLDMCLWIGLVFISKCKPLILSNMATAVIIGQIGNKSPLA